MRRLELLQSVYVLLLKTPQVGHPSTVVVGSLCVPFVGVLQEIDFVDAPPYENSCLFVYKIGHLPIL